MLQHMAVPHPAAAPSHTGQLLAQDSNRAGPEPGPNQSPEFPWNGPSVPYQLF